MNAQEQMMIRVLVVDDSAVFRELILSLLKRHPRIDVIATAESALDARDKIKLYDPDVITLDVEMQGMSGIEFLEKIMALRPMPVVMCSSHTAEGTATSLQALSIGAVSVCEKPGLYGTGELDKFSKNLSQLILAAAQANPGSCPSKAAAAKHPAWVKKRRRPKLIAIGASTGGPQAVERVVTQMPPDSPPILVAMHMAHGFSEPYARRLSSLSQANVKLAENGEEFRPGNVYIAPDNMNMLVRFENGGCFCEITIDGKTRGAHTPSVDMLFESLCDVPASQLIAVLLTGMGSDGAKSLKLLQEGGVHTIVQHHRSCVVYGMPKRAIELGAAKDIVPLDKMAQKLLEVAY